MREQETNHEELEAFREEISAAIDSTVFILESGQDEGPFTIDPYSLGLSDQTIADLSIEKQKIVKEELYNIANIIDGNYQKLDSYRTGPNNELLVRIIEGTNIDENGDIRSFYIHEIENPEGQLDWQISSSFDRIQIA